MFFVCQYVYFLFKVVYPFFVYFWYLNCSLHLRFKLFQTLIFNNCYQVSSQKSWRTKYRILQFKHFKSNRINTFWRLLFNILTSSTARKFSRGSNICDSGGKMFYSCSSWLGWQRARRLQRPLRQTGATPGGWRPQAADNHPSQRPQPVLRSAFQIPGVPRRVAVEDPRFASVRLR